MSHLAGKRILITRPRQQAGALARLLTELGAQPVISPAITIAPLEDTMALDQVLGRLGEYDWVVFTSANGVAAVWERLGALNKDSEAFAAMQVAAIGPATAGALNSHGVKADFVPPEYVAEAIAEGLGEVTGRRILLLRADIAREALAQILDQRGALVDNVPVYRTLLAQPDAETLAELERGIDIVTLTSASTVRGFLQLVEGRNWPWLEHVMFACIGPITAAELRANGRTAHIVAEEYTTGGLIRALQAYIEPSEARER